MQKEIKQTWHFNQPTQEVWDYLTKPELIEQWLTKTDFQPIVGNKFQFTNKPKEDCKYDGITQCEVLEVVPLKRLSYSWKVKMDNREIAVDSIVIWTLVPKENGTELQLQHTGFPLLEDVNSHTKGWNNCMNLFTQLLNNNNNANTNA